jgi:hypothetical protein
MDNPRPILQSSLNRRIIIPARSIILLNTFKKSFEKKLKSAVTSLSSLSINSPG